MKTLVISDLHLAVNRTGGTTPQSLASLRAYGHSKHRDLLELAVSSGCKRVLVNGDLTDQYSIPLHEAIEIYAAADEFLSTHQTLELVWSLGNHDKSTDSTKLGTVAFLGQLLEIRYPERFTLVAEPKKIDDIYVIPHCSNQDRFDLELDQIPDNVKYVALHCCYDNTFAAAANHSLNLARAKAKELVQRGLTLILGHEHQGRTLMGDKVVIVGNNFSSSVSDCLTHGDAQKDGMKYCLEINGDDMELIPTWSRTDKVGGYAEIDWECLGKDIEITQGFVRVTGSAPAAQSADVIKAISKYRQASNHFVITNAVRIDGLQDMDSLAESVEDIRSVNVIDLLLAELSAEQQAVVRKLLEEV